MAEGLVVADLDFALIDKRKLLMDSRGCASGLQRESSVQSWGG